MTSVVRILGVIATILCFVLYGAYGEEFFGLMMAGILIGVYTLMTILYALTIVGCHCTYIFCTCFVNRQSLNEPVSVVTPAQIANNGQVL